MASAPSIRVIKSLPFKGGTRQWSNRYHFTGGTPADATHWHTLMDNVTNAEKLTHVPGIFIQEALGYAAGSDVPVATKTYSLNGTATLTSSATCPGECAALTRWSTAATSTKNHPIYLFSYKHYCHYDITSGADADHLNPSERTLLQTYATAWITGFSDGAITAKRSSPNGAIATGSLVEEFITHRDFPYTTSV